MNSFRKKYWEFSDRHPKFNRVLDQIYHWNDRCMIINTVILIVLFVAIPSLCMYLILDESIRKIITPIISAVFSVIIVPVVLNYINNLRGEKAKRFELNKAIYDELSEVIILLLKCPERDENVLLIKSFLQKYYPKMCVSMPTSFIWDVYLIYRESKNNNNDNVLYYSEKCIRYIRKQVGLNQDFYFSQFILEAIGEQDFKEEK